MKLFQLVGFIKTELPTNPSRHYNFLLILVANVGLISLNLVDKTRSIPSLKKGQHFCPSNVQDSPDWNLRSP